MLCDLVEEGWPSMELCAEALLDRLAVEHRMVMVDRVRPPMRRRATRITPKGFNVDRFLNRFFDYPRVVRRLGGRYDAFHVVDHSYAHLVHELPRERTGVFCHDLDTFRCLLGEEQRPRWFRAMTRRILSGMQEAAVVFCSTGPVRERLIQLIDPGRIVQVPYGTAPEFTPADGTPGGPPFLLHVGSCIERKRIDVLFETFAALRRERPDLGLTQVGGTFTKDQEEHARRLGIADAVTQTRGLDRARLAALYRSAALVLQPSEREGFGLPVIEALACGAVVLASDIPVLREVGGDAVVFAPVGDIASWSSAARRLTLDREAAPSRETRLARARLYSWSAHARSIVEAYEKLSR